MKVTIRNLEFENLRYQLIFQPDNQIVFGLVASRSARYQLPYDPFEKWGEQDDFVVDDINVLRAPVSLLRAALQAIFDWISSERPGYFFFSAATDRKVPVYERIASRIARKMGYNFLREGATFHFFRPQTGMPVGNLALSEPMPGTSLSA